MRKSDRTPLKNTPVGDRIAGLHNNRLGAVYSSLYAFWQARHATTGTTGDRRDAYSVLLHDDEVYIPVRNDFTSTPDDLLTRVLPYRARLGTNFTKALQATQSCMERNWSAERCVPRPRLNSLSINKNGYSAPVIIFLSDGQSPLVDSAVRGLCNRAVSLGYVLTHTLV